MADVYDVFLDEVNVLPVIYPEYVFSETKAYHSEQLLSVSQRDYKVRNVTDNPKVGFLEVVDPSNDEIWKPVFRVDCREFEKLTGDTAYITTWHPDKNQRKPLYYLEEVNMTKKYKLVRIRKGSKDGEIIFTVREIFFTINSMFNVYPGEEEDDKSKRLLKLKANLLENKYLMTTESKDTVANMWTDFVQATKSFRFRAGPGMDHSLIFAFMAAARLMKP